MKKMARGLIFGLLGLFLLSTSGFTVLKHYCEQSGISYSFFTGFVNLPQNESINTAKTTSTCCTSSLMESKTQLSDNCCKDNFLSHFKKDLNTSNPKIEIAAFQGIILASQQRFISIPNQKLFSPKKEPPNIPLPQRLSLIQTFLI